MTGQGVEPDDDLARDIGRELGVVGRSRAATGHLHERGVGIGARRRGRHIAAPAVGPLGLARLELGQSREGASGSVGPLTVGPLTGGGHPPGGRPGVVVELGPQGVHLGFGQGQGLAQGIAPAERRGTRAGPDPDAVLGDPVEGHETLDHECRDTLGQEPIEQRTMGHPEVGQGVVVDRHAAAQPAVRVVLGAQPVEGPGAADRLDRRIQPQRGQDGRVDRRAAGLALDRPDTSIERAQIEALDEGPHETRPVVGRQEALEIDRAKLDLVPVRALQSRHAGHRSVRFGGLRGRDLKEGVVHGPDRSCDASICESPP